MMTHAAMIAGEDHFLHLDNLRLPSPPSPPIPRPVPCISNSLTSTNFPTKSDVSVLPGALGYVHTLSRDREGDIDDMASALIGVACCCRVERRLIGSGGTGTDTDSLLDDTAREPDDSDGAVLDLATGFRFGTPLAGSPCDRLLVVNTVAVVA